MYARALCVLEINNWNKTWCFAGNMIFYRRLRKAHVLTGKYFQNIIHFSITFAYDWARCAFLCLYIILKWMLVWYWKKKWFIHVSGNAKQITSVSLQHKRFYFFALWQAILVVDGHSINAKEVSHLTTHRTKKTQVWSLIAVDRSRIFITWDV